MDNLYKKIFVFDIDGTIIQNNESIDSFTNDIFNKIVSKGHTLVFATARSIRGARKVLPKWCFEHNIIYCNGAFSTHKNTINFSNPIDNSIIPNILNILHEYNITYYIDFGKNYYHDNNIKNPFFSLLKEEGPNELIDNTNFYDKPIYKIVILSNTNLEFINKIRSFDSQINYYFHSDGSIDLVSKTCSKWNALSCILNISTSSSNIISFGNDMNDYELLKNSFFGVAIEPKHEQLLSISNKIIDKFNINDINDIVNDFI